MPWWNRPKDDDDEGKKKEPEPQPDVNGQFVTQEYFDNSLRQLGETLGQFMQPGTAQQPKAEPEPEFKEPSVEEINAAWLKAEESGEATDFTAARALERQRNDTQVARMQYESDKRFKELQAATTQNVGPIQYQNAIGHLKEKEYFSEYQEEIEDYLSKMDPTALTPRAADQVYSLIIGQHFDDIRKKEVEKLARQQDDTLTPDVNTRNTRQQQHQQSQDEVTPETIFGADIISGQMTWGGGRLWEGGHENMEAFARKLGYANAQEYAELGAAMQQIEDCPECGIPMTEPFEQGKPHACPAGTVTHTAGHARMRAGAR